MIGGRFLRGQEDGSNSVQAPKLVHLLEEWKVYIGTDVRSQLRYCKAQVLTKGYGWPFQ